jgi:uncharacterized protein (DUF849 family)
MIMAEGLIISFTLTGMLPTKGLILFIPVTVPEIVEGVQEACGIGASMVHLHAWEVSMGKPTYKAEA